MSIKTGNRLLLRWFLLSVGGIAIVAAFFFGTLWFLDDFSARDPESRDRLRAQNAKSVMAALEKYRSARGTYPVFAASYDVSASEIKKELVKGGYLGMIAADPVWPDRPRYVSYDGKKYGLLIHLELFKGILPTGEECLTGVGTSGTNWWGQPPNCPF
jgi:hypothetical protein